MIKNLHTRLKYNTPILMENLKSFNDGIIERRITFLIINKIFYCMLKLLTILNLIKFN